MWPSVEWHELFVLPHDTLIVLLKTLSNVGT